MVTQGQRGRQNRKKTLHMLVTARLMNWCERQDKMNKRQYCVLRQRENRLVKGRRRIKVSKSFWWTRLTSRMPSMKCMKKRDVHRVPEWNHLPSPLIVTKANFCPLVSLVFYLFRINFPQNRSAKLTRSRKESNVVDGYYRIVGIWRQLEQNWLPVVGRCINKKK